MKSCLVGALELLWALAFLMWALSWCSPHGPSIEADRRLGWLMTIKNTDGRSFQIQRIVANNNPGNSNCNDYPARTLVPGETYNTTFFLCGHVTVLTVETDRGASTFSYAD
jgi:hypothetical protein